MAAKFVVFVDKDHSRLPAIYWLPKLHERPYKSRFIANSGSCTTTELSILLPSCLTAILFSQTIGPIELEFHVKTPYDKLAKICAKYFGHMTKMTATPIYGKNPLKIFFSRTSRPVTLGLGM